MSFPPVIPAVGSKFDAAGNALPFAGSSIVSAVPAGSALDTAACQVQQSCQATGLAPRFAFLPPASFHMTLCDLLCDQVRTPERWSTLLPLDSSLEQMNACMLDCMAPTSFPLSHPTPRMKVTGIGAFGGTNTLHLHLNPFDEEAAQELTRFREAVSEATGIRHPDHERYFFHVSLAYPLSDFSSDERVVFEEFVAAANERLRQLPPVTLGPAYLSLFEDMLEFPAADPSSRRYQR